MTFDKKTSDGAVAISVVLPVDDDGRMLSGVLGEYVDALDALGESWEIVVVHPTDGKARLACERIASVHAEVKAHASAGDWGASVRVGLQASIGGLLCYTNYQRTSAAVLSEMLSFA
ncbi:MAG TPA: hypothetical protein VIJ50_12235, partial [Solirubrobacteraceae bacterium]